MFRLRSIVIGLLLTFGIVAMAQDAQPKTTVLVVYKPGPGWVQGKPLKEQPLKEHGAYMLSLYTKGMMKTAGPFADDAGGALVLEVPDFATAQQIIAEDPAVKTGVFVQELHPWGVVDFSKFVQK